MSVEENNKELIRQMYDLFNRHELDAAFELYPPDWHEGDFTLEQVKQIEIMFFNAFPDVKFKILDMVAEGDKVAYMLNLAGTHTGGPYMGIPPTFKKIDSNNTYIVTIVDNKIVEHKIGSMGEIFNQLQQLGVIPMMAEVIQAYNDSLK